MNAVTRTQKYWMEITDQIAQASTCRVKLGCVLMHQGLIVGTGYTGSLSGDQHCCDAGCLLMETELLGSSPQKKETCIRTMHAELNAVLKCAVRDSMFAFCTYEPCLRCTQALLQIGVRAIYYRYPYKDVWRDVFLKQTEISCRIEPYDEHGTLYPDSPLGKTINGRMI